MTPIPVQHIAVGILQKPNGEVLVTSRPPGKSMAGYWEFPGGKIEPGETIEQGLKRELQEELAITVNSSRPLITLNHHYKHSHEGGNPFSAKNITLHVRLISAWSNQPTPQEQQAMAWELPSKLRQRKLLPADWPIVTALELPVNYWITPDPVDTEAWLSQLERVLQSGIKLIQLRATNLGADEYERLAKKAIQQSHHYKAKILLNANPDVAVELGADGVHLNTRRLINLTQRPLPKNYCVAASCHNADELKQAQKLAADFAVLGPVKETLSHPDRAVMGWQQFSEQTSNVNLPVYALGGLTDADKEIAWQAGAQGIAAMRGFIKNPSL